MECQSVGDAKNLQLIDRPSVTRHAGLPAQSDYRRLPADERVQVQQNALVSREAIYADVSVHACCCTIS
jgi:hypothetical protein